MTAVDILIAAIDVIDADRDEATDSYHHACAVLARAWPQPTEEIPTMSNCATPSICPEHFQDPSATGDECSLPDLPLIEIQGATIGAGLPLTAAAFAKPPLNIPGDDGRPYKTELVVERGPHCTVKINWWHGPDDTGSRARPHNHPWGFTSVVLHGAITHTRFRVVPATHDAGSGDYGSGPEYASAPIALPPRVEQVTETIQAGQSYWVGRDEYHLVTAVEPGTVTRMVCGEAAPGNAWGYLDLETGAHMAAVPDPEFRARLAACNPWMTP